MASRTVYSTWTPQKPTLFDGHYLRNRSTLDIGVLGYIGIVPHKEHSPEVLSIPPGAPCITPDLLPMHGNDFDIGRVVKGKSDCQMFVASSSQYSACVH